MGLWNDLWRVRDAAPETRSDTGATPGTGRTPTIAPARSENIGVTGLEALSLSAVYRAISLLGVSVKQCSLDVYRGDAKLSNAQVPSWVRTPNTDMSSRQFVEVTTHALAAHGNAYWRIDRDASGKVLNLVPLDPRTVNVQTDTSGNTVSYTVSNGDTLAADRIKHLKLVRQTGAVKGLGPIQAAQRDLRAALDTRDYSSNLFAGSGVPTKGYLKTGQQTTAETAARAREAWTEATSNPNGIPVLDSDFDYKSVLLSPKDAQWIESQRFSTTQIARIYGIPASMLLADIEGTSQQYANVSQMWVEFTRFGLMQYLTEIEDAISSLIPGLGQARFNVEALLRADTTTRYTAYQTALTAGWLTPNEVRAIEGLPPLAGGDAAKAPVPAPQSGDPNV